MKAPKPVGQTVEHGHALRLLGRVFDRSTQEMIVFRAADGQIELTNHAVRMNLGYSRDGLLCKTISDICPGLSRDDLTKLSDKLSQFGAFVSLESSLRRRVGSHYPVKLRLENVSGSDTSLLAMFIQDKSRDAVATRQLDFAMHAGKHCFSCMNLDTWEIQRDPALDQMYGFADFKPDRTAHDFIERVLSDHQDAVREQFVSLSLGTIEQIDHTFPIHAAGDGVKWIHGIGRLSDHDPRMVVGMQTDVTEARETRLRAEQKDEQLVRARGALASSEKDLRELLAALPDAVTRAMPDTILTFANERYCDFLGLSEEEVIGRSFFDFIPESAVKEVRSGIASLTPEAPMISFQQPMGDAESDQWFLWSNLMRFDNSGVPVEIISVGRDISELLAARSELADSNVALEKRNIALEKFSATVAHDLKLPIRNISMFVDMMRKDLAKGQIELATENARRIAEVTDSMTGLIDGLLEYSQIAYQDITREVVDLAEVTEDAKRLLWRAISETSAQISVGTLPVIEANHELLVRLFQNIIGNSIKFAKPGTVPEVMIAAEKSSRHIEISFADNGIGVDPKNEEWIFGIFQRLHHDDEKFPGTGIGLALAREIAESHGGSLRLDPQFSGGSRFMLRLPLSQRSDTSLP